MSLRIGFFTGIIYDSSVDAGSIKECCKVLSDEESISVLEEEGYLIKKRKEFKKRCEGCFGCEESKKAGTEVQE